MGSNPIGATRLALHFVHRSLVASHHARKIISTIESSVPSEVEGPSTMQYVYIIKNYIGKLYVGISENPNSRLKEHNTQRGAVFTESGNFKIVFKEEHQTLSEARKREIQIKKWRRDKKENLIKLYAQGIKTKIL